jgi:hypothetical protein
MTPETIGVTVTYNSPITFHLRMIGIAEETELRQNMFGLTEKEKAEKSYQNNVDLLADLSVSHPDVLIDGKLQPFEFQDSENNAVRSYFAERTIIKERVAEYAVRGYFVKLQPDVSFL